MKIEQRLCGFLTFTAMVLAIIVFLAHGFIVRALISDPLRRRKKLLRNIHLYSKFAVRIMRVEVLLRLEKREERRNCLMVCNHMSYLDMIVLASVKPSVFITSVDMGQVFFLGTIAEISGAIFVERRNRDRLDEDIAQIEKALNQGLDVTLFPEGTSSNGSEILPFKRSLLSAALNSGTPVRPVTLKYFEIDGEPFSEQNRDVVCWYGRAKFLPHFFRLLSARSIRAKITYGELIAREAGMTKHTLTEDLHRTISLEYSAATV